MKRRNQSQLLDYLDEQREWRTREISFLRGMLENNTLLNPEQCQVICRAFVPMVYAHWEGYIKLAAQAFVDFVANQKHPLQELSPAFQALYFSIKNDKKLKESKRLALENIISELKNTSNEKIKIPTKNIISAYSNLNSTVLAKICLTIGITKENFNHTFTEDDLYFIDEKLVKSRNDIAHGRKNEITIEYTKELSENILRMTYIFKETIEDLVERKGYLSSEFR
ncbi:MAG: MAE_28990/MAE_18760 family HEPN-like nuclease [Bombella sp.]|nr:MAE_28990/MAE_18760 family HEPN-like nuclease [Bombella sp.]